MTYPTWEPGGERHPWPVLRVPAFSQPPARRQGAATRPLTSEGRRAPAGAAPGARTPERALTGTSDLCLATGCLLDLVIL